MGRNKKRRRTQALHEAVQKAAAAAASHGKAAEDSDATSVEEEDVHAAAAMDPLSPQNLAIVIRALQKLSETPERLHEKQFKDLRRVLHPLVVEQCKVYQTGVDYKTKVTVALAKQQWSLALEALKACKDFEQIPKQGTIQRWVRDVGNIANSNSSGSGGSIKIPLLTAILNLGNNSSTTNNTTRNQKDPHDDDDDGNEAAVVDQDMDDNDVDDGDYTIGLNKHDPRAALLKAQQESTDAATTGASNNEGGDEMKALEILDHWTIPGHKHHHHHHDDNDGNVDDDDDDFTNVKLVSTILYQQAAAERKPPNHYDLLLHTTTEPGCIQFDKKNDDNDDNSISAVQRHDVPFVKGGFVLQNVLSRNECAQFMAAATRLGYRPDHPTSMEHPTGIDSCEWLIDSSIHNVIFDRVQSHLPQTMRTTNCCYKLHSINCRWRFFRYSPESVYRPHIDGSWPESRVNPESGEYETDTTGKTKSFLTFLIYLNQDFAGGQTRFYYSSSSGGMKARGITPSQGCVLVFPQGNTASLLHEGSAVLQGTKFVIRTDVLYSSIAQDSDHNDNDEPEGR